MDSIRVRLTVDLTEYHPSLRVGTEGFTVSSGGMWSRGMMDSFTGVRFPEAGVRDILRSSLEIVDEEYLRQLEEARQKKREALRTATDVVLHLGPNGGFRGLSCRYEVDGHTNHEAMDREEADEALALFEEYGIPVKEERAPRQSR